jgi:hypothetical protein
MYRDRLGFSRFVLDRTKRRAPGWREIYKKLDGSERERSRAAGKHGRRQAYRLNQNRHSESEEFKSFQPFQSLKPLRMHDLLLARYR